MTTFTQTGAPLRPQDGGPRQFCGLPFQKVYGPDRIGLVGFESAASVIVPLADPHDPVLLEQSQRLHTRLRGMTNVTDGLRKALGVFEGAAPGYLRRVWLLTDGYANREEAAPDGVIQGLCQAHVNVNTIGFGDQFDEALLRRIAAATHRGQFVSVRTLRGLTDVLCRPEDRMRHPRRRWHRSEITVLAIDLSGSMAEPMEGRTKIAIVEEAILNLLRYKQALFA
jgi:Mg-chelatase subunit ChlD